ncbi:hypothetical protein ACJMK2_034075 [Sinanodonta woodiana]|uniref:Secreted protein n=1 Tax=Sinanodonta woodiana TaxID=1069815 RepID=A0ABD3WUN2_SINWO
MATLKVLVLGMVLSLASAQPFYSGYPTFGGYLGGLPSPIRGPGGQFFLLTGESPLFPIQPDGLNGLPTMGGNGDAVDSFGQYINTQGQGGHSHR